ncbi:MAG: MBL fold metallo-hydrolase [Ignavibacterium sp.]|nr:MBL fold metallo-hydrolase [Ignavibacterium sp.]MCX7612200.1 MBL fold metallo-hydrolase [Ignavibacterium sp.]MDW8375060.1 MBL fold metallo-hydrolase [Ignavibacteriales bacterium]
MKKIKYPLSWTKNNFSIKIFCSIPNIATGIVLKTSDDIFLIDPGDGILRDLTNEFEVETIKKISDVFITHGHHDHVGGLWSLLTYLRVMNKKSQIKIHFPDGCSEIEHIYKAFVKVYQNSVSYKIILNPIKNQELIKTKRLKIKPFPVIHKEIINNKKRKVPSLGYNFYYNKMNICYGGDTAYCEELVENAKGADLAVIEAGQGESESDDMHLSIKEAKAIGKLAKEYFLVHVPE